MRSFKLSILLLASDSLQQQIVGSVDNENLDFLDNSKEAPEAKESMFKLNED